MAPLRPSRRTSRPASPAGRTSSAAASPRVGLQSPIDEMPSSGQTSLDAWLEPPLRVTTAYEDAGMDKSALFENMQPLGALPNPAKLKYKPHIRTNDKRPPFRAWGENTVSTPELTPPVEVKTVEETNGVVLPSSRAESVEKEAFPPLNGTHTEEVVAPTPPLVHDAPSPPILSPQSPVRNEVPVVTAVGTPTSMSTVEMPPHQTSTPRPIPATQISQLADPFTSPRPKLDEKTCADAVYNANQRAQEAGEEALGEALIGLYQFARQPEQHEVHEALVAVFEKRESIEQAVLFGTTLKQQRAIAKRKLRTKVITTRPGSVVSPQRTISPEPAMASQISAPVISTTPSAPTTPVITSNPPNPPMGNFHTTPSRPVVKPSSLLRTPREEVTSTTKPKLQPPATPPLQSSPKFTSRKSSNAVAPESPAVLGKRRRREAEVSTPDATIEDSNLRKKRRAISNATKEIESTQSDEPKINGLAARLTRSRRSLGTTEHPESSPKTVPQTPPARTRSGRRRQSSSDLSSVDEEIVNEGPPPAPVPAGVKRTAAEAALDDIATETNRRRRRFDEGLAEKQQEWENIPQESNIRSPAQPPKEQTLKINVTEGRRTTRSGAQRRSQREESIPLTPALPSPREGLIPGASRATRSSQQFSNAEQLLGTKPKAGARFKTS
jgi:hypothetical protein